MEKRIGTISVVIYEKISVEAVNKLLSEYAEFILARHGLPLHNKGLNIISIIIESTSDKINALTGKLGRVSGVEVKSILSKYKEQ